uniref:Uncharacterized protein n=1 Tax=Ditylenchus dipsaci TaxID=166011 RepID=A0A915E9Z6_9BILA
MKRRWKRCLYKVATESSLTAAVDEIRKTYRAGIKKFLSFFNVWNPRKDRMSKQVEEDQKSRMMWLITEKNGGFFLGQQADESDDTESDSESERPRRAVSRLDHPKKPGFRNPNILRVKKKDSHSFKRKQMGFEDEKLADSQDRKDAKQLHPSWSAKQMKLKQEAELMKAPPQNKRMTFDD